MSTDTPPVQDASTEPRKATLRRRRFAYIPHLFAWIVGTAVLLGLIGFVLIPVGFNCGMMGAWTRELAQAKSVGLALKLFAGDHDGVYPRQGTPVEMQAAPANSNAAFACLFPAYIQSETIFGNKQSAYQTREPDNVFDRPYTGRPVRTLEPGENVYGYVAGLSDADNPGSPLVVDGTDGTGHYVTDSKRRGGVGKGRDAVVIHLDNSGVVEKLTGPDDARYLPRAPGDPAHNLLDVSFLNKNARLLDPAVASP